MLSEAILIPSDLCISSRILLLILVLKILLCLAGATYLAVNSIQLSVSLKKIPGSVELFEM